MLPYNKKLREFAGKLRRNMTDAEKLLWSKMRGKQLKGRQFYRQKIIENYIVDFYCSKAKLVVEVDGGQHYSCEGKQKDSKRDIYMERLGLKVLRFSDRDVFENLDGVIHEIWENS